MSRSLAISCLAAIAAGALALASFQSSNAPEFAPEIQSGRVVTFLGNDFSTRRLLVQSRRGDLVATTPLESEVTHDAEQIVIGALRQSHLILDFGSFADWRAKAEQLRSHHRSEIARGKGWISNGNGPAEAARELISQGENTIATLDALEAVATKAMADASAGIADDYKTSPLWINLRTVAGYRVN